MEHTFHSEEDLDNWVYGGDSDWGEGYSHCELVMSPTGKGLFRGELSTRVRVRQVGLINNTNYRCLVNFLYVQHL